MRIFFETTVKFKTGYFVFKIFIVAVNTWYNIVLVIERKKYVKYILVYKFKTKSIFMKLKSSLQFLK